MEQLASLKMYWWIWLVGIVVFYFIARLMYSIREEMLRKRKKKRREIRMRIHLADGRIENRTVSISHSVTIGRSDLSDLYFEDEGLSREHFEIMYKKGELFIRDLNATNGTFVNGLELRTTRRLQSGDWISAGTTRFIVGW